MKSFKIIKTITPNDLNKYDLKNVKLRIVKINNILTSIKTMRGNLEFLYNLIGENSIILKNTRLNIIEGNKSFIDGKFLPGINITVLKFGNAYDNLLELCKLCNKMKYKLEFNLILNNNKIFHLRNKF